MYYYDYLLINYQIIFYHFDFIKFLNLNFEEFTIYLSNQLVYCFIIIFYYL